jgi:hypothetical protein
MADVQVAPDPGLNPKPAQTLPIARAKFRVDEVKPSENIVPADPNIKTIVFTAVVGGSPENDEFFHLTPAGSISLSTVNEVVSRKFAIGDLVYVDFTKAE